MHDEGRAAQRGRSVIGSTLILTLVLAACADPSAPVSAKAAQVSADASKTSAQMHPELWPQLTSPVLTDAALEARVQALLATLSIEEKVGQIVQADLGSVTPEDVRRYRLGSVLAGGNSDPQGRYNASAQAWLTLMDAFYLASMDTSGGGKAIPLLLGIDAVHGHNNVLGATLFPHNIGLGAANDVELIRQIARVTATELRVTGFEWTFAPTVTVPRDDRWGRSYEGYSEDPVLVARYAGVVVDGLQGAPGSPDFLDARHVLASAKHFIGDGGTQGGRDQGDTQISEAELRDVHGPGYVSALNAGVQSVMASFSSWNGSKIHGHRGLLTDVLKGRMGFNGFVVGDWNAHGQVPGCNNENCADAFIAGIDMLMAPDSWRGYYDNAVAQVRSGRIPLARLDDAVSRILRVKFRLGLFEAGAPSLRPLGGQFELLGSSSHRAIARDAVRKSMVLIKNNRGLLPLSPHSRILVAGDAADDVGKQSGGWTLSWQGTGNQRSDFPNATSIWEGIRDAARQAGGKAELAIDGDFRNRPDAAIVVFGEEPYAEFQGDIPNLEYQPGNARDLALLLKLKAQGIPVISVFLSGRPLWVNREINASDAFVAAWLPGSEGAGVADLLLRQADESLRYEFTGRLSFSWPRTAVQTPLNHGEENYDPLFPLGYGLNYTTKTELADLPENSGLDQSGTAPGVYFERGRVAPAWAIHLRGSASNSDDTKLSKGEGSVPGLRVSVMDDQAQEDARRLSWSGDTSAQVSLRSEQRVDLSRESNGDVLLILRVKVIRAPTEKVSIGLGCGENCQARIDLSETLQALPPDEWQRIGVPLKCFAKGGADLRNVTEMAAVETAGALELVLSRVALGTDLDVSVACPSP